MRPLIATIDLARLRANYITLKQLHGQRLLAVLKADAYGHGAVACARALQDLADGFAVACLEEAVSLRQAGISGPIVLLEGVFEAAEYAEVAALDLWPVVQNQWQLAAFLAHPWPQPVTVWLKMDSGMHRAGFDPADYAAAHAQLTASAAVAEVVKMSHFACADVPDDPMTAQQIQCFDAASARLPGRSSLANSAAILAHPAACRDWGRAGLALYGVSPLGEVDSRLQAVMRLQTRVFGERHLAAGEAIGYGATFRTEVPTRVGLIACGYADGYPRLASTGSPVLIDGHASRVIGRVSMDMMTVELNQPEQGLGSMVELWGDGVPVQAVAAQAGTIAYELLTHLKRAQRCYVTAD